MVVTVAASRRRDGRSLFLAMFSHEHGLDQQGWIDTHVTDFGNQMEMVQDGEFMRHVHVTVFRNQTINGLLFHSECPPAAGAQNTEHDDDDTAACGK